MTRMPSPFDYPPPPCRYHLTLLLSVPFPHDIHHTCTAGKIASWEACKDDAIRRDSFWPRRQAFLEALPPAEQERLEKLSAEPRDDSKGEAPGSARGDEEERLFMASLSEEERRFVEGHKGLGNSQKAEVAWLEKQGYAHEEVDVGDFELERPRRSSNARFVQNGYQNRVCRW